MEKSYSSFNHERHYRTIRRCSHPSTSHPRPSLGLRHSKPAFLVVPGPDPRTKRLGRRCKPGEIHKRAIATRRRALNDKNSPLLKLPAELIAVIGYLVMGDRGAVWLPCSISNWRTPIAAFMDTSSRLRRELDTLRSEPVTFHYTPDESTPLVGRCREISLGISGYCGISHRGPLIIAVSPSYYESFSAAAAIAGFMECLVFGRLRQPPVVYARREVSWGAVAYADYVYVSYARELNLRVFKYTGYLPLVVEERPINTDEARAIWERAKASKLRLKFAASM